MIRSEDLEYQLQLRAERVGDLLLTVESLANLDRTIDQLFARLKDSGDERLLEDLCPYFGVIWPAARALAEHLATDAAAGIRRRRLLELGCGLALPSLVAARVGARVTATDFHPEVPRFLARNLRHNGITNLEYLALNWREQRIPGEPFDWIVGSDILYESYQPSQVARAIDGHLAPGGTVLLADPGRPHLQTFQTEMERLGFESRLFPKESIYLLELVRGREQKAEAQKTPPVHAPVLPVRKARKHSP